MPPAESHEPRYDHPPFSTDDPDLDGGGFGGNLLGDFYRESHNVTRGVDMAPRPDSDFKGFGGNDLYSKLSYQEPDELLADVPMGMDSIGGGLYDGPGFGGKDFMQSIYEPGFPDLMGKGSLSKDYGIEYSQGQYKILGDTPRFPEPATPPRVPDPPFALDEAGTLHVTLGKKFEPSKIGNDLLDFFSERVSSHILKVNIAKFSVKANVFVDNRMCTLKAKVFHVSDSKYAVEFGRRKGDACIFVSALQEAAHFFREIKLYSLATANEAQVPRRVCVPPPLPPSGAVEHGDCGAELTPHDLTPILDMLDTLDTADTKEDGLELQAMQAEAARALCSIAADAATAPALWDTKDSFRQLLKLLKCAAEEVAYPTAQLFFHLAQYGEASALLANMDTLLLFTQKVCSKESRCLLVKSELAKVIKAVVQGCADKFTPKDKETLAGELVKAAEEMGEHTDKARVLEDLEGACQVLRAV